MKQHYLIVFLILLFLESFFAQEAKIIRNSQVPAWSQGSLRLQFTNNSQNSLFLMKFNIENKEKQLYGTTFQSSHHGKWLNQERKVLIPLTIEIDDPGAAARLPHPPIATETGDKELTGIKLLQPGESFEYEVSFLATYDWSNSPLKLTTTFVHVEIPVYQLNKIEDKTVRSENAPSFAHSGQKIKENWEFHYEEQATIKNTTPLKNVPLNAPRYFPPKYVVSAQDFLKRREIIKETSFGYKIKTPDFDIEDAIATAKSTNIQFAHNFKDVSLLRKKLNYFIPGKVWWYVKSLTQEEATSMKVNRNTTYFFGNGFCLSLNGDLANELEEANRNGPNHIKLYTIYSDHREDKKSQQKREMLIKQFQRLNYKVQQSAQKGGGYEIKVAVPGNRLIEFKIQ